MIENVSQGQEFSDKFSLKIDSNTMNCSWSHRFGGKFPISRQLVLSINEDIYWTFWMILDALESYGPDSFISAI